MTVSATFPLRTACLTALLGGTLPVAALAQGGPAAVATLGAGAKVAPAFPGSDEFEFGPSAVGRLHYLRLPGGLEFGSPTDAGVSPGLGLRASFRYLGSRDSGDFSELEGLDDVDASLELGLGVGYETRDFRVFADLRNGVIGHNAWVAEVGADAIVHPTDALTLNLGPRVNFGDDKFVKTYFGVSDQEAAASSLDSFDASSGVVSVGVELGARYAFTDRWGIEGSATYDRLVGDAGDSPIVDQGSEDQYTIQFGITRRISLGF